MNINEEMTEQETVRAFVDLWQRLANYDVDITFENGETHKFFDPVEICWTDWDSDVPSTWRFSPV